MSIGLLADGLLIVLLVVALVSVYRLNKRMAELREGRAAFEKLTTDLAAQTKAATESLAAFRANAEGLGKQLDAGAERGRQVIAEVQRVSDDLRLLIGRADASSTRLEEAVGKSRREEAVLSAMDDQAKKPAERGQPERIAEPEVSAEAKAFLSSLSGMR
jgi:septal ring factor EnvC (AmiA/AmiB activator)